MPARKETFKNSNVPKPVRLPKGKIEKIDYGEHQEEIFRVWRGLPPTKLLEKWKESGIKGIYNPGTKLARMNKVRALIGYNGSNLAGHCCKRGDLNTHLVKFRTQGITIIERYCTEHVPDKI